MKPSFATSATSATTTMITTTNSSVPTCMATNVVTPSSPLSNLGGYDEDVWVADFSDTLFNNLCNNLFEFPDPKSLGM